MKHTLAINKSNHTHRITPHKPLTYVRMVLRQHATTVRQHAFIQPNRIRISSKCTVRRSKIAYGLDCTSCHIQNHIPSQHKKRMQCINSHKPFTYDRMVLRQHLMIKHHHHFPHIKRIRVLSKFSVHRSKIAHGVACTSC
jgi:hypothetical protein